MSRREPLAVTDAGPPRSFAPRLRAADFTPRFGEAAPKPGGGGSKPDLRPRGFKLTPIAPLLLGPDLAAAPQAYGAGAGLRAIVGVALWPGSPKQYEGGSNPCAPYGPVSD